MRILTKVLLACFLISVSFTLFLETEKGQTVVLRFIEEALQNKFPYRVHIGKLHCFFPLYLQMNDVSIEADESKPVLFFSSLTACTFPIPLSSDSFYLPYLSVTSFSVPARPILQAAHASKKSAFSLSISNLCLYNGEVRDPHFPLPYAFSFKGSTSIDKEGVLLTGSLYDQTSVIPIQKAKGTLRFTEGAIEGGLICSLKRESMLSHFQKLELTFAPALQKSSPLLGSWKLLGSSELASLEIESLSSLLQGSFSVDAEKKQWTVTCEDYSVLIPHVTPYQGNWRIEGVFRSDYSMRMALTSFLLHTKGTTLQLEGKLTSELQEGAFHLAASLEGTLASTHTNTSFTAQGKGFLSPLNRSVSFLATSPFFQCEGEWNKERATEHASLFLRGTRLSRLFQGAPLHSFSCSASYSSERNDPYELSVEANDLLYKQKNIHALNLKSSFHTLSPLEGTSELVLKQAKWNSVEIETASFHTDHSHTLWETSTNMEGKAANAPFHLNALFKTKLENALLFFESPQLEASIGTYSLSQKEPSTLTIDTKGRVYDIHTALSIGLEGSFSLTREKRGFSARYEHCPTAPFTLLFLQKEMQGELTGQTDWASGGEIPRVSSNTSFTFQIPFQIPTASLHIIQGKILAETNKERLETTLSLQDLSTSQTLSSTLSIPILPRSFFPFFSVDSTAPLTGRILGTMNAYCLFYPLIDENLVFSGNLAIDAALRGSLSSPRFTGSASLRDGSFLIPTLHALLTDIQAEGYFQESRFLFSTQGVAGKDGSLQGNGFFDYQENDFNWQLRLALHNAIFIDLPSLSAAASGEVSIDGKNNMLHIASKASLTSGTANLIKSMNSSYPSLPITYVTPHQRHRNDEHHPDSSLTLAIELAVDRSLTITGRSFESIWSGHLSFQGPVNTLHVLSHMTCDAGTIFFAGRKLAFERGKIDMDGTSFKDSKLDIVAVAPLPHITARIFLGGRLDHMTVDLRSSPIRSEREILSLLLFNKEITNISPFQSLQLANTLLALERKAPGSFFLDTFKSTLGIDTIDISSPSLDPNEVTLSVGKYLSEGVIVTLSKDITSEANRVGLEVGLTDEITASAAIGDDADAILSLTWKKEF